MSIIRANKLTITGDTMMDYKLVEDILNEEAIKIMKLIKMVLKKTK